MCAVGRPCRVRLRVDQVVVDDGGRVHQLNRAGGAYQRLAVGLAGPAPAPVAKRRPEPFPVLRRRMYLLGDPRQGGVDVGQRLRFRGDELVEDLVDAVFQ